MILLNALEAIGRNAQQHQHKEPTLGTLLQEVAELARALEGKHHDPACLELVQIGGIVANMLRAYSDRELAAAISARANRDNPSTYVAGMDLWPDDLFPPPAAEPSSSL